MNKYPWHNIHLISTFTRTVKRKLRKYILLSVFFFLVITLTQNAINYVAASPLMYGLILLCGVYQVHPQFWGVA
jgi:hypothetical protein